MRRRAVLGFCALVLALGERAAAQDRFGNLPISFEANVGQTDERARFLARVPSMAVFFTDTEAVMVLDRIRRNAAKPGDRQEVAESVVKLRFAGANPPRSVEGLDRLPGVSNYYLGNDPARWHTGIPQYGRIAYRGIYPGVDLVAYGNHRQLEYDFVLAAQADPRQILLEWEGVDALSLNADGDLVLQTSSGSIVQKRPRIYQETPRGRHLIAGKYTLGPSRRVGFALARYDRRRPVIIDPQLVYSTYLGGSSGDQGFAIAVDSSASAYVAGATPSANFPVVNPVKAAVGSLDAFVTKINSSGTNLVYSSYFGGGGNDKALGIALDSSGAAYVTGTTLANNFPTLGAFQGVSAGDWDAFVTKFTPAGALAYSSYLGGAGLDTAQGIAVDSSGAAYVAGYTLSTNFPTTSGAFRTASAGGYDVFVAKVAPGGGSITYATYLGGKQDDQAWAIAVDSAGAAYVTGNAGSTDFPVVSAYQSTNKGSDDVFVTKIVPNGSAAAYSTFVGGSARDDAYGIAVDSSGSAYVAGRTQSADFPVVAAYQSKLAGNYDTFVFKLNASGNALAYSTYVGGSGAEAAWALAVDGGGNAYVGGWTQSTDFPTIAQVQTDQPNDDGIVYKLSADGGTLVYSTYLGGTSNDYVQGIAVDAFGAAYVTGWTDSVDFITQSPIYLDQPSTDAFIAKLDPFVSTGGGPKAALTSPTPGSVFTGNSVTFTWSPVSGATAYALGVGVGPLNFNIFDGDLGLATSQTVTGIPTNGATIYVRLFTQINGSVLYNQYTFKAFRGGASAVMSSPTPGSLIQGGSATFTWTPAANASSYRLDVGSALGAGDIFAQNVALATSQAVSGLPIDGSTVYVRLTTYNGSVVLHNDYTYSGSGSAVSLRAVITSPVAGSTLSGATVTFTWTAGTGVSFYWLQVGSLVAAGNYFDGNVGLATSQAVTNLPIDGSKVYVRLWSRIGNAYQYDDYTYTASGSGLVKAAMTSPTPGSTLQTGSNVVFTWSAGTGAGKYYLDVGKGTTLGNIFSQDVGLATGYSVSGLPTDGSPINVRLWTWLGNAWQFNDYTYTASGAIAKATLLLPTPGTRLSGSSVTFTWDPGLGASAYFLDVGTSQGVGDLYSQSEGLSTSQSVTGLPTAGTLYVRLWTQFGQSFQFNDYTYTAPGVVKAAMASPTPGTGFTGASVTFTWNAATSASGYALDIGDFQGRSNFYSQVLALATSATVNGLPTDGSTVWVRLWTLVGGVWVNNDYSYKAAGGGKAVLSSPPPSSAIAGPSATFTWAAVSGAAEYWLDVGTTAGGFDIFSQTAATATSLTVSNLPPSGRTIYVRLWTVVGGVWQYNDYTYTIQ